MSTSHGKIQDKQVVLSALNLEENAFTIVVLDPKVNPGTYT